MFYRYRFDSVLGRIFKAVGYTTSMALDFWSAGATADWIESGQKRGWRPAETAAFAFSMLTLDKVRAGEMSAAEGQFFISMAHRSAAESSARPEVLGHISELMMKV